MSEGEGESECERDREKLRERVGVCGRERRREREIEIERKCVGVCVCIGKEMREGLATITGYDQSVEESQLGVIEPRWRYEGRRDDSCTCVHTCLARADASSSSFNRLAASLSAI